jgi:PPP family 3-phenylpropionic acid transporter
MLLPILLSLFYFFYFSVVGVYLIFLPKVLSEVGYSAEQIGIVFAAAPLVRFILPFFFIKGAKINRTTFNISLFIMLISSGAFYLSLENFYALVISNIFLGIGLSLVNPYIEVISLQVVGKERYGKIRLYGSVGFVLVALLLVKLLSSPYVALDFLVILTFITTLVSFVIAHQVAKREDQSKLSPSNDINLLKDYKLWLGLVLMQVSFGAFYNFFTIYATNHGISLDTTVYLWSFGVLAEIVMLYFQGRFLRNNLLFILQLTAFITAIRWFLVYAYVQNIEVLYFSQMLHAFSFALFHSAAISYLHALYKHKALAQQFFSGIAYGLGGLCGALLSGFIYERFPEYLFLSSSIIAFGAFVSFFMWERSVKLIGQKPKSF